MCQLCHVAAASERDRWPKPLEPSVSELRSTVESAHPDVELYLGHLASLKCTNENSSTANEGNVTTNFTTNGTSNATEQMREGLIMTVRMLLALLDLLEQEREDWWKSKAKLRRELTEAFQEQKLTQLQGINNKSRDMVQDMRAKIGLFARWTLDVRDLTALE